MTGYRLVKKVTYKTIRKVVRVTSGDMVKVPKYKYPVTALYGPPAVGDRVPATNRFSHRVVGLFRASVYAIGPAGGSPLKIGIASNPVARRDDLQIGNWVPLLIHRVIFGGNRPDALDLERDLIRHLAKHRIEGVRGDWFSIDVDAFDVAIREVIHGTP